MKNDHGQRPETTNHQVKRSAANKDTGQRSGCTDIASLTKLAPDKRVTVPDDVAKLAEVQLRPEEIEGFVKPVAAKAEAAPGIADQIDNNAKDQFLDSRDLRDSIIDAAFDLESAVGKLSGAAMGDDARAEKLIRIIGEFMWETRREDVTTTPYEPCAHRSAESRRPASPNWWAVA